MSQKIDLDRLVEDAIANSLIRRQQASNSDATVLELSDLEHENAVNDSQIQGGLASPTMGYFPQDIFQQKSEFIGPTLGYVSQNILE